MHMYIGLHMYNMYLRTRIHVHICTHKPLPPHTPMQVADRLTGCEVSECWFSFLSPWPSRKLHPFCSLLTEGRRSHAEQVVPASVRTVLTHTRQLRKPNASPSHFPAHSISEPPPAPISPRMSREEARPQRHLLGFSEPGQAQGIEHLQEAAQGPEEQQPSPAGRPSFR